MFCRFVLIQASCINIESPSPSHLHLVVYCSNAKLGTLEAKETVHKTPPADGASLATIISKVKKEYGGEINGEEFKSGKWVVDLSLPLRNSATRTTKHKIYYDAYGKIILNTMTD